MATDSTLLPLSEPTKPAITAPTLLNTSTTLSNGTASTESIAQIREAYSKTKQELIEALAKKRDLDRQLIQCEVQLYEVEAQYLAETSSGSGGGGNIIQGFDGYLKNTGPNKRRNEINDGDRMFSNSSSTYAKSLELRAEDSDTGSEPGNKFTAPALQTVMLPPAPRQQEVPSAAMQKRDRDRLYQRQKRARKEGRGTASGDENDYNTSGGTNKRKRPKATEEE
ncbi:hypothetical protein Clacol_009830 [Clathrus columnatus]|uniref:Chromatin modification-related protein EAF6 n=1 Tax=Clathrus columnatus TaxID=1419009 RepID=A0AAV5AP52_9AGAM|nr:hypothetical protein Clacol_009830 [Clathrus columnatus]